MRQLLDGLPQKLLPPKLCLRVLDNAFSPTRCFHELGGTVEVEVVSGAGHQVIDAFFKSKNLIEFLIKNS